VEVRGFKALQPEAQEFAAVGFALRATSQSGTLKPCTLPSTLTVFRSS